MSIQEAATVSPEDMREAVMCWLVASGLSPDDDASEEVLFDLMTKETPSQTFFYSMAEAYAYTQSDEGKAAIAPWDYDAKHQWDDAVIERLPPPESI